MGGTDTDSKANKNVGGGEKDVKRFVGTHGRASVVSRRDVTRYRYILTLYPLT